MAQKPMKPRISVITCTKNREKLLPECLKSVEKQSFRNIEHIFVDGMSTDETISIIEAYKERNADISVKIIKREPKGIADAFNVGVEAASGEIIHILNSDDYLYDNEVYKYLDEVFTKDVRWLMGNKVNNIRGKITVKRIKESSLRLIMSMFNWPSHPNTFVRRSVMKEYGKFNENLSLVMDYEYWLRMLKKEDPVIVDRNFAVFRMHSESASIGKISGYIDLISEVQKAKSIVKELYKDNEKEV